MVFAEGGEVEEVICKSNFGFSQNIKIYVSNIAVVERFGKRHENVLVNDNFN